MQVMVPFEGGVADGHMLSVTPMMATGKLPGEVFVDHPLLGGTEYRGDPDRGAYVAQATYWPPGVGTPPPGFGRR